jgi:hypothetical protein
MRELKYEALWNPAKALGETMRDHSKARLFRYIAIDQTDLAPVQPGQESAALLPDVLARLNRLRKGTLLGTDPVDGLEHHLDVFNSPIVGVPLIIETDEPIQLAGIFRSVMSGSGNSARLHVKEDTELTVLHWIDVGSVKIDFEGGLEVRKGRIGNLKAADGYVSYAPPFPRFSTVLSAISLEGNYAISFLENW